MYRYVALTISAYIGAWLGGEAADFFGMRHSIIGEVFGALALWSAVLLAFSGVEIF
jgi:hypothetical protein